MKYGTFSYGTTPVDVITKALNEECHQGTYNIELVGDDTELMRNIVNQGIDAHLEAVVHTKFKWASDQFGKRLVAKIDNRDMLVILRRLAESDDENAGMLRSDILQTIGIEEI